MALALALVADSVSASTAKLRVVRVGETVLSPARVGIPVGGTVEWRDVGRRSHTIASTNGAWPAFVIRPGKTHSRAFSRAGVHPYRVDGQRCGVIGVAKAPTGTCGKSGGAGGGGKTSGGFKTVRYDISLSAAMEIHYTSNGVHKDAVTRWTGSWKNAVLRVFDQKGSLVVEPKPDPLRGTLKVDFNFGVTDPSHGTCNGSFATTQSYRGRLDVSALASAHASSSFRFRSQLPDSSAWPADRHAAYARGCGSDSVLEAEADLIDSGCAFTDWSLKDEHRLSYDFDHGSLVTEASLEGRKGRPFPLAVLARHAGFSFFASNDVPVTDGSGSASLRVTFARRR